MTSLYSQTRTENLKIEFPKTKLKTENINKSSEIVSQYYDVYSIADRFDPNISGSPPNVFISTLKQRMDVYFSDAHSIRMNTVSNL